MNFQDVLISKLNELYNLGFSPLASYYKQASLYKWKGVHRDFLRHQGISAIRAGRANSLSLRLDNDLIAFDLDFHNEKITQCFIDWWHKNIGIAYTVQGVKGCKIFARLSMKFDVDKTIKMPALYMPETNFLDDENTKNNKNEIEIKQELSAVFGMHSENTFYGFYPNTMPFILITDYNRLPAISDFCFLDDAIDGLKNNFGLVPFGGVKVSNAEMEQGIYALMLYRSGKYEPNLIMDFLDEFNFTFALECVEFAQSGRASKYKPHIEKAFKYVNKDLGQDCNVYDATFRVFNHVQQHLADYAVKNGVMTFEKAISLNVLNLYKALVYDKAA